MSSRSTGESADWSATAPTIHAIPSATEAVRSAPKIPSTRRSPGNRRTMRARAPMPSKPLASTAPASNAPSSPESGAYSECDPPDSTSGPRWLPRKAPTPKPTSDRTPTMNPCV